MQDTNLIRILLLGFTIVIALLGLIGVVAVQETNQQANRFELLYLGVQVGLQTKWFARSRAI